MRTKEPPHQDSVAQRQKLPTINVAPRSPPPRLAHDAHCLTRELSHHPQNVATKRTKSPPQDSIDRFDQGALAQEDLNSQKS